MFVSKSKFDRVAAERDALQTLVEVQGVEIEALRAEIPTRDRFGRFRRAAK